ncbi:MAG: restriction endonuclease subunit S [Paludibacteraceae bacterium]|nr:restriction endonuclease subunit S [Paludibacteraceae bacterium]
MPFEVPSSWVWTTVNSISKSILYGVSESAKASGKYKLLRITDIQNNSVHWDSVPYTDFDENKANSYLLSDGDILFARTGATVGKSYLVQGLTKEAIYASYLIRVQTYNVVLPQYVKFYFESGYYWEQIEQESVGVGQPNVNGTILGNLHIPIPPIHEQCRIVSELTKWMGIIDVIEQGKTDLQTVIKQAKSKILDLAIHGKLVPQDPNDEPASELLKRINSKAEITCDNGQYGKMPFEIPNSWLWLSHNDILEISGGSQPAKSYFKETPENGYIRLYQIRDYGENPVPVYIPIELASKTTQKGDILLARYGGSLGKVFIAEDGAYNVAMAKVIFKFEHLLDKEFVYFYYLSKLYQDKLQTISRTAQAGFNSSDFEDMYFPLPPIEEQQRTVYRIKELYSILDKVQKTLEV